MIFQMFKKKMTTCFKYKIYLRPLNQTRFFQAFQHCVELQSHVGLIACQNFYCIQFDNIEFKTLYSITFFAEKVFFHNNFSFTLDGEMVGYCIHLQYLL